MDTVSQSRVDRKGPPLPAPRQGSRAGGRARLTHSEVHGVPLAQGPQAVQAAALVVILQELNEAWGGGHQNEAGAPSPQPASLPPKRGSGAERGPLRYSLWYMEKDKNWFRNFWYMRPSGLR